MSDGDDDSRAVQSVLRISLQAAVPLHAMELRNRPWSELQAVAQEAAQVIAEKGDLIMFKSTKKGESAKAFNALARALAILSFVPGGVKFLGDHWENTHSARDPR